MAHRAILTERQRSALFDLPTDETLMLRHYTLADDDIEHISERRRPENKIGFALQLCALRYPGRLLSSGEVIPEKVLRFIAAQLGLTGDDVLPYAERRQTRQQHLHALRQLYGVKMFSGQGARSLKAWLEKEAETARSNEDLARRFIEECRRSQVILPGISVVERLCVLPSLVSPISASGRFDRRAIAGSKDQRILRHEPVIDADAVFNFQPGRQGQSGAWLNTNGGND